MGALLIKGVKKLLNRDNLILTAVDDMLESPFNAQIQQQKCDLLHGLISLERNRFQPGKARLHQMKIGDAGGVEVAIAVLKNHNNELALRAACRLLSELARDEGNSERMRKCNVDEFLDKVAKDNYDDEYIVADIEKAKDAMVRSGAHLEHSHIRDSLEKRKIPPIVRALLNQPANIEVQIEGLDALWVLCKDKTLCHEVKEVEGLFPVVAACKNHQANVLVMRKAYGLIAVLAKDVENSSILGKSGAIQHLLLAFKNFKADFKLLQQTIWALNELAKYEPNLERIEEQGAGNLLRYLQRAADEKDPPVKLVIPLKLKRLVKKAEDAADSDEEGSEDEEEEERKRKEEEERKKAATKIAKPPPKEEKKGPPVLAWKQRHA